VGAERWFAVNRAQYKTDLNDAARIDPPGDVIASNSNSLTNKVDATLGAAQRRFYRAPDTVDLVSPRNKDSFVVVKLRSTYEN